MKMRIQLIIENESGLTTTAEIAAIERGEADDLVGISLEEAKTMTGGVQRALVESQAHEAIHRASTCPECQAPLRRNGSHRMSYRTPFGRLELNSPRFYQCRCQTMGRVIAVSSSRTWARPPASTPTRTISQPCRSSHATGRAVAGCSTMDVTIRRRLVRAVVPRMARLLASVPPDVNMISSGSLPMSAATSVRARSIASCVRLP